LLLFSEINPTLVYGLKPLLSMNDLNLLSYHNERLLMTAMTAFVVFMFFL